MPALTPEQRRKQIEMQRNAERNRAQANKPKPGQKGVQTGPGSSSLRYSTKPTAKPKPAAKPAAKGDWRSKVGNTDVATLRKGQDEAVRNHPANKPAAKAPAPKPQPAARPAAVTSGGSTPASRPTSSAAKTNSNVGPVANGDDYARNKDPKKYNPLMQKTFGYQSGDAPDQRAAKEKFTGNDQTSYKPQSKVDGSKYEAGKAATNRSGDNNPDVASKATNKYLEEIEKKRKGQSNVIG